MEHSAAGRAGKPDWFGGSTALHRFLLGLTGSSGPLYAMATAPGAPGEEAIGRMLDFLADELVRTGYGTDFQEPGETGHRIEALIDVFDDLLPDDE